jgi:hypothetical protein
VEDYSVQLSFAPLSFFAPLQPAAFLFFFRLQISDSSRIITVLLGDAARQPLASLSVLHHYCRSLCGRSF